MHTESTSVTRYEDERCQVREGKNEFRQRAADDEGAKRLKLGLSVKRMNPQ